MGLASIFKILRISVRNLWAAKGRNGYSVVTTLIGSSAIVATMTINKNIESYITSLLKKIGGPSVTVIMDSPSSDFSPSDVRTLASLPLVKDCFRMKNEEGVLLRAKSFITSVKLVRTTPNLAKFRPLVFHRGTFLNEGPQYRGSSTIVVSPEVVKRLDLFKTEDAMLAIQVGARTQMVKVVGVAEFAESEGQSEQTAWVSEQLYRDLFGDSKEKRIVLSSSSLADADLVEKATENVLTPIFGNSFYIHNPGKHIQRLKKEYQTLIAVGFMLGTMALLAGNVGVMNIMALSVSLRRREIGLYRALGYSSSQILLIFMTEMGLISAVSACAGLFVGGIAGVGASYLLFPPHYAWDWNTGLIAALVTIICGFIFGLIPAKKALAIEPYEALKG